jgi:hypothetical protein
MTTDDACENNGHVNTIVERQGPTKRMQDTVPFQVKQSRNFSTMPLDEKESQTLTLDRPHGS